MLRTKLEILANDIGSKLPMNRNYKMATDLGITYRDLVDLFEDIPPFRVGDLEVKCSSFPSSMIFCCPLTVEYFGKGGIIEWLKLGFNKKVKAELVKQLTPAVIGISEQMINKMNAEIEKRRTTKKVMDLLIKIGPEKLSEKLGV